MGGQIRFSLPSNAIVYAGKKLPCVCPEDNDFCDCYSTEWLNYKNRMVKYEFTLTQGYRGFTSVRKAYINLITQVGNILKFVKKTGFEHYIDYFCETHEDGYPHIHGILFVAEEIPHILINLSRQLNKLFGRNQWYLYDKHRVHGDNKLLWEDYIRKDYVYGYEDVTHQ